MYLVTDIIITCFGELNGMAGHLSVIESSSQSP